jgi:hypothetical protein
MIKRRGDKAATQDIKDMLKVFLEAGEDIPRFVAADLSNLPPLSLANSDSLHLRREIESMKADIKTLTDCQSNMIGLIKQTRSVVNSGCQTGDIPQKEATTAVGDTTHTHNPQSD